MQNYIPTCPHCHGRLNNWLVDNFLCGRYLNKKLHTFRSRPFCTKDCYENYKSQFAVEIYNNQIIYCVEIDGAKRYMPYFEAYYYFTNIDDCKKRMDMTRVAVLL